MAKSYLRYPDNFFAGTRTLSLEQRGAFNDLLDLYISRDGHLPDNDHHRARELAVDIRLWRRMKRELIEAGKMEIKGNSLVPTGAATTLAKCLATSVAAKEAADSRWRKQRKLKETRDANAMPSSQDKLKHKEEPPVAPHPDTDVKIMVEKWNAFAAEHKLSKVQKITTARIRAANARLKDCGGLDGWAAALEMIRGSPFLLGQNNRGWVVDFNYVIKDANFTKIMEGGFNGRPIGQRGAEERRDLLEGLADAARARKAAGRPGGGSGDAGEDAADIPEVPE